jgi:hypothetical protein
MTMRRRLRRLAITLTVIGAVWLAGRWAVREYVLPAKVLLPETVKFEFLLKSGSLRPDIPMAVDPAGRPMLALPGRLVFLRRAPSDAEVAIPTREFGVIEDIEWIDDWGIAALSGRSLLRLSTEGAEVIQEFPRANMRIARAGPGRCYVYGDSSVYLFDLARRTVLELARTAAPVAGVVGNGTLTFIASDTQVYAMAPGESLVLVHETEQPVLSMALSPDANLFVATGKGVSIVSEAGAASTFLRCGAAQLAMRGAELFVLIDRQGVALCSPAQDLGRYPELLSSAVTQYSTSQKKGKDEKQAPKEKATKPE